jgi:general stress protein 26
LSRSDGGAGAENYVALRAEWDRYVRVLGSALDFSAVEVDPVTADPASVERRPDFSARLHLPGLMRGLDVIGDPAPRALMQLIGWTGETGARPLTCLGLPFDLLPMVPMTDTPGLTKKLDDLYELIDGIEIAMFTTRRPDGHLVSRPMATQTQAEGSDLWFVTDIESQKLDELEFDPHVNLAYYRDGSREWVSVSGTATVSRDRRAIHDLYRPDWKAWFGDEGGERDGGPDDPRLALILVDVESVTYLKVNKPRPVVLFEVVKGMVTGSRPNVGEERSLSGAEVKSGGRGSE